MAWVIASQLCHHKCLVRSHMQYCILHLQMQLSGVHRSQRIWGAGEWGHDYHQCQCHDQCITTVYCTYPLCNLGNDASQSWSRTGIRTTVLATDWASLLSWSTLFVMSWPFSRNHLMASQRRPPLWCTFLDYSSRNLHFTTTTTYGSKCLSLSIQDMQTTARQKRAHRRGFWLPTCGTWRSSMRHKNTRSGILRGRKGSYLCSSWTSCPV